MNQEDSKQGGTVIDERWFSVDQIAARLQVTEETVRRWLRSGELAGRNFGGRTGYRIREADVNAFLERSAGGRPAEEVPGQQMALAAV